MCAVKVGLLLLSESTMEQIPEWTGFGLWYEFAEWVAALVRELQTQ